MRTARLPPVGTGLPAAPDFKIVELAALAAGTSSTARVVPMWQLDLIGLFIKPIKEMKELRYEFENDHILDSSEFETRFDMKPTPLRESLASTLDSDPNPTPPRSRS